MCWLDCQHGKEKMAYCEMYCHECEQLAAAQELWDSATAEMKYRHDIINEAYELLCDENATAARQLLKDWLWGKYHSQSNAEGQHHE
jgi:hypothetical protein